jgi:protein phosphatase
MNSPANPTPIQINGFSHIGKAKNRYYEDRIKYGTVSTQSGVSIVLGVVADGIGGENAGERAATLTVDKVFETCQNSSDADIPELLQTALEKANSDVFHEAQRQQRKRDMGSTAVIAAIFNNRLYIANVGDSRVYLIRNNKITQLTVDHTWEHEVVKAGKLSSSEAARHPRRDELVRSIGYEAAIKVDLGLYIQGPGTSDVDAVHAQGLQLQRGDRVILCSDGLIKPLPKGNGHFVEPSEIVKITAETPNTEAPKQLVQKALDREVDDNVSVIVMEVGDGKHAFKLPQPRVVAGVALAVLVASFLGLTILSRLTRTPPSIPTLPPVSENQVYIAQVWNLSLQVISPNGSSQVVQPGTPMDFKSGEAFQTTNGSGYVYIGLPGQAQLYLGGNTEIILNGISSAEFDILLNQGWLLVNQPGRKFLVTTPDGSQAWVSGSMMGLQYNATAQELYIDCLQDMCWVSANQPLPAGFHALLKGNQVVSSGPGTQNELWQFVPNLVATPTSTPSPTVTPNIEATQACNYYQSLGTPCPPPK